MSKQLLKSKTVTVLVCDKVLPGTVGIRISPTDAADLKSDIPENMKQDPPPKRRLWSRVQEFVGHFNNTAGVTALLVGGGGMAVYGYKNGVPALWQRFKEKVGWHDADQDHRKEVLDGIKGIRDDFSALTKFLEQEQERKKSEEKEAGKLKKADDEMKEGREKSNEKE